MTTMQIPLSRGLFATVDAADFDRVMAMGRWCADPSGHTFYARKNLVVPGTKKLTSLLMHDFVTGWTCVDHRNGDGLDNRRANLRQASYSQNGANRRTPSNNTSGFKGVSWSRPWRKWIARIGVNGERLCLGGYETAEEAARAYDAAALNHFGEFARLNFPLEPAS